MPTRLSDNRIYPKEFVLGLVLNEKAKAYPFSVLSRHPVINDTFQKESLLVVFDSESATGVIFRRKFRNKPMSFKRAASPTQTLLLIDDATKSL